MFSRRPGLRFNRRQIASQRAVVSEADPSLAQLMLSHAGFAWDESDITGASGSGPSGTDQEALTSWPDSTGAHDFVPCDGAPLRGTDGAGQPVLSDPHTVVSHGRPYFFGGLQRAAACDDAGVGDLLAGAACPPFCFWITYQCGGTSPTTDTVVASWGAPFYGGAPANAPYISIQATASAIVLRFQFTGGTTERLNITLSSRDSQQYTLLVVSRGHGQPMLIRLMRNAVWETIVDSANYSIADVANTDLLGLTRLAFGGLYAGDTTNIAETTRSVKVFGYGQCIPPADQTEREAFITDVEALLLAKFGGPSNHVLTSRAIIVNSSTSGFSPPATTDPANIMHPALFESSGFKLLFGNHDDAVVSQANCSGDPLVPENWTVVSAGTGISMSSLAAAGGHTLDGGSHIGSPEVVDRGGGNFTCFIHASFAEYDHHTFALTGTSFTGGEGVTWDWANSAAPLSDPANESHVYMRSFRYGGRWYGVTNGAILLVGPTEAAAPDGVGAYAEIANEALWYGALSGGLAGRVRHCGVLVIGDVLLVAYTCSDEYEHIKLAVCNLAASADPEDWRLVHPVTGDTASEYSWVWPYLDLEGANMPWAKSATGAIGSPVRQLRDPQFYATGGTTYLLWAGRGEDSIVIADATAEVAARLAELPF